MHKDYWKKEIKRFTHKYGAGSIEVKSAKLNLALCNKSPAERAAERVHALYQPSKLETQEIIQHEISAEIDRVLKEVRRMAE